MSVIDNTNLGTLWNRILGLFSRRNINGKSLATDITINDEDIPSSAVTNETTVEGALGNLVTTTSALNTRVPAPGAADASKYLKGNGSWATPAATEISQSAISGQSNVNGALSTLSGQIGDLQNGLAIVVNGNTSALGAATGQFIALKNSTITNCADGFYTAAKPIPANTPIDNTYLYSYSDGGLNKLQTGMVSFIDTSHIITQINSKQSYQYIATEDCWVTGIIAYRTELGPYNPVVKINGVPVATTYSANTNSFTVCAIPVKANQTVDFEQGNTSYSGSDNIFRMTVCKMTK